jgi:hypothetical protein
MEAEERPGGSYSLIGDFCEDEIRM